MLPQSVQSHPGCAEPYEYGEEPNGSYVADCAAMSGFSGASSIGVPLAAGSSVLLSKASDTKSSHFVADTLSNTKSEKKIPS